MFRIKYVCCHIYMYIYTRPAFVPLTTARRWGAVGQKAARRTRPFS